MGPINNPRVRVNVDEYRDMFISLVLPPPDADTERCCHCHLEIGVCECIPAAAILNDDYDSYTVIDATSEEVV